MREQVRYKRRLEHILLAVISIFSALEVNAQNVQLHYDIGRSCATSTVEMFRADGAGSTFFFVDLDYSPKVYGAGRKQNSYS